MSTQRKTIILTIVRHGATDSNKQGIAHGSTDTPLNDLGIQQAKGQLISKHFQEVLKMNSGQVTVTMFGHVTKVRYYVQ